MSMTNVFFTRDVNTAIIMISEELKRMNDLKEKELYLKYGDKTDKE